MGNFYIKFIPTNKKSKPFISNLKSFKLVVIKLKKNSTRKGRVMCCLGHFLLDNTTLREDFYINFELLNTYLARGAFASPTVLKYVVGFDRFIEPKDNK